MDVSQFMGDAKGLFELTAAILVKDQISLGDKTSLTTVEALGSGFGGVGSQAFSLDLRQRQSQRRPWVIPGSNCR